MDGDDLPVMYVCMSLRDTGQRASVYILGKS